MKSTRAVRPRAARPIPRTLTTALSLGLGLFLSACDGGSDISALIGGGSGPGGGEVSLNFALRQDLILGAGFATDLDARDIDGDGLADLIETEYMAQTLTVAFGDPAGEFAARLVFPTPGAPVRLAVGDFGGDGLADVAVACREDAQVGPGSTALAIYEQAAGGGFTQTASLALPGDPFDLAVGPISGGAADDLIVTMPYAFTSWHVALTGPGLLEKLGEFDSSGLGQMGLPLSAALIDIGNDGVEELLIGEIGLGGGPPQRVVLFGDPLAPVAEVLLDMVPAPIVRNVGDMDGNGFDELGIAEFEGSSVHLALGGPAGLQAPQEIDMGGAGISSLLVADLNQDGIDDLGVTLFNDGAIALRMADAAHALGSPSQFGPLEFYNVGNAPRALSAVELPGDSIVDLACSNGRPDISLVYGEGGGAFAAAPGYFLGDAPQFVRCADLDGDGDQDAVAIDLFQRKLVFMEGAGDGSFEKAGDVPLAPTADETPGYLLLADFDGDGLTDVMTSVYQSGEVLLLRGTGSLPLPEPQAQDRIAVGSEPLGLDAADLNGDGLLDVVVANAGDGTIQLLLAGTPPPGSASSLFTPQAPVAVGFRPLAVLTDDLDGDGDVDVAVSTGSPGAGGTRLVFFEGDGTGSLVKVPFADVAISAVSATLGCGDFDADGLCDLVASQSGEISDSVIVLHNLGGFLFQEQAVPVGENPGTLEIADANQDGDQDLMVPLGNGGLRILLGDGQGEFPDVEPPGENLWSVPYRTNASAYADVDGDERPDLVMTSPASPYLWIGRNRSTPIEP